MPITSASERNLSDTPPPIHYTRLRLCMRGGGTGSKLLFYLRWRVSSFFFFPLPTVVPAPPLSGAEQGLKPSCLAPPYPGTLHGGRSQFEGEDPEVRPHIHSDSSLRYQTLHTYTGISLMVRAAYPSMTLSDILDCKTLVDQFSSDF